MNRIARRAGAAILLALLILLPTAGTPASALTPQRKWTASVGVSGANGRVMLQSFVGGTGYITYDLKGLRAGAVYKVTIRKGSCAKLGTVVSTLPPLRTTIRGTVSATSRLLSIPMFYIWQAARSPGFVVRIQSGTSVTCGAFGFVHATRVAVSGVGIDLPIIRGPDTYPPCNVAMYSYDVAQPLEPGITFIFAHARTGMFLPLLTSWRANKGASLIGRTVYVWTSANVRITYKIVRVRVTHDAMAGVTTLSREQLWLQTSTGPNTSYPKLIVEANRVSVTSATRSAAQPTPHPIKC